ncbi:MAG TPA: thioredoxin domain-containing protein [Pyrinomonadaceae bacterium]|nr:thioredoxin domain-containing protein [Pyrinomonadaceae bacterium]
MRKEIKILALIAVVVVVAAVLGANYYRESKQGERKETATADDKLVRPDSPSLGPAEAPVTLVEFLDPECESCGAFAPVVKRILKDYDGKVRLVVRYMPFHPNSRLAASYTEAAGEQGKYWEMQEMLFRRQGEWGEIHGHGPQVAAAAARREPAPVLFERYAQELGLDVERVRAAVAENRYAAKVERDMRDGQSLGVSKTPTFFVNGRMLMRFGEAPLRSLIEEELKK